MAENTRETQLRGLATEWRTMTYNWRDCALYAQGRRAAIHL